MAYGAPRMMIGAKASIGGRGALGMDSERDLHYRRTAQWLADQYESIDLEQWVATYPSRRRLLREIDEAAQRAQSRARLEDALTRLH